MSPEQTSFLELAKQLRKTGAIKVEQTPGGFCVVWATVLPPEKPEPVAGAEPAKPPRAPRKPKDPPKVGTPEEEALKQLREELA